MPHFTRTALEMISDILDPLESNKDEVSDKHLRVCLEIAKELLKHSQSTNRNRQELDPILLGLEATILGGVSSSSPELRKIAQQCLGILCLSSHVQSNLTPRKRPLDSVEFL